LFNWLRSKEIFMANSVKHHYIPQFFLKGFTNESGQFFIYDKSQDRIKRKPFYPSTHFFQEHRNTITINGESDDAPEQFYQLFENKDKLIVKHIQEHVGSLSLSHQQMAELQHFLSNLFFRLPALDSTYKRYIEESDIVGKFFKIKSKETGDSAPAELLEKIRKDPAFQSVYRSAIGSLILLRSNSVTDHENWGFTYRPDNFNLMSDNPLIFNDLKTLDFFENTFVVPLSGHHKLIRLKKPITSSNLSANFSLLSEVLVIHQAKEYVCCASKEYLEHMVWASKRLGHETCRTQMFQELGH